MRAAVLAFVGASAVLVVAGCASPAAPAAAGEAFAVPTAGGQAAAGPLDVGLRLAVAPAAPRAGYAVLAVVGGWRAADVHHATLTLHRAGAPVAGAALTLAGAALGTPVALRNLRAGTAYEVRVAAWADAAQATPLADAQASRVAFTTPAVAMAGGVAAIDDAVRALALPLVLAPRAVSCTLAFRVAFERNVEARSSHVRWTLRGPEGVAFSRVVTADEARAGHVAQALRPGTAYTLLAEGLEPDKERKTSADAASAVAFETPAIAGGTLETSANASLGVAVLDVPCRN